MARLALVWISTLLVVSTARAQGLPVTFEIDDPRDGLYEQAAVALRGAHVQEQVPVTFQVVPCGVGSRLAPYQCVNNTGFHDRWGDWMRANPDLIDVGQHGNNHREVLANLTRAQQLDLLQKGLTEMETWGLPDGTWNLARPFSMAAPFASSNTDTISVLEQLDFHTSVKNSGTCHGSSILDVYCNSVPLCEVNAQGGRVSGPSCVIKAPETLIAQVNARASEGKVFIVYHAQDVVFSDLQTVNPAKMDALRAVLQAFRDREIAGDYDLMTLDEHYRQLHGLSTPGGGGGAIDIYQDSLESPWIDASWSATIDYASTTRAFSGDRSIRVSQFGWGALSVHRGAWSATQPIDPADHGAVELRIFPENTAVNVTVQLENDAGESFPLVSAGTAAAGTWTKVSVPLDDLSPQGRSFDRVDVASANGTSASYSIDELRITDAGGSRLAIFEEALESPWVNGSWSATIDFASAEQAFEGTRSIRVAQVGWGALSLRHGAWTTSQPLDPAEFESVDLVIFSGNTNFNPSLRLENDAGSFFPEIAVGTIPANTWMRITVSIDELNPNDLPFDRVDVRNWNGTNVTYYVDRFGLVRR